MARDFLLEIGTEPMPARFIPPALEQLKKLFGDELAAKRFSFNKISTYGTLRRLAVIVEGLSESSTALEAKDFGPPADKAKDASGAFTPAAEGFAKKCGVNPSELGSEMGPRGMLQLVFHRVEPGQKAQTALSSIVAELIPRLEFAKSMEWEETRLRFGRPIRSLTALFGKLLVPVRIAGVRSGRGVAGLAALAKKPVSVAEPKRYLSTLKGQLVLADPAERREALVKKLEVEARKAGGKLDGDQDLIEETVFMTEHPAPVAGRFKSEYLALPAALLSLVMKKQLKFFPLHGKNGLLDTFLGVRDGVSEGQALVREGYQRVIAARLSDAAFFLSRDQGSSLESKLPGLERVTYQKALGSMASKAKRVAELSAWFCDSIRQDRPVNEQAVAAIAKLCYADLVTEVVKEFPELQGTMGGWYARKEGMDERVALGLEQFYQPTGPKSPAPLFNEGALVSLAGKLDSLAGCFAAGLAPTGSADPFALRRQALGAVRILLERQLPIDLRSAFEKALALQPVALDAGKRAETARALEDFAWGRAQSFFEDLGYRVDEVRSVKPGGLSNLSRTLLRLSAVKALRKEPDFEALSAAFKRAANILKQAKVAAEGGEAPERALLKDEAELALYDNLNAVEGKVRERIAVNDYELGLRSLVAIKPHLDKFFEGVMVMAEDPALRRQRLSLLARLVRLFNSVADLSELQPSQN